MMKATMGITFALAVMAVSPASAQAFQGNWWDGYRPYAQQDGYRAYAQQHGRQRVIRRHSPHRSWDAYSSRGHYVGSDPDPNVRDMIARDPEDEGQGW
jgi:hypothetical protein